MSALDSLFNALVAGAHEGDVQMSSRQMTVLLFLRKRPGAGTKEISEDLKIGKGSVTRALDFLQGSRLIRRETVADDHRLNRVYLSLSGIAYLERLEKRLAPAKQRRAA